MDLWLARCPGEKMACRHLPAFMAALLALAALAGCGTSEDASSPRHTAAIDNAAPAEPPGPPAPEVQAALRAVLDAATHPWLNWQDISGVLPDLEALYQAEPDGLFWFRGDVVHPALASAIEEIDGAGAMGFNPEDYDATPLADRYGALLAGSQPSAGDRALLDLAVSVSAMRLLSSAHQGRVDPRLVGFDHDPATHPLDLAALLRDARDAGGLAAAIATAEPRFPVYRRLVKALAHYRAMAVEEPPRVPELPAGRKKIAPGEAWAGTTALAQRLRAFGDLSAEGLALKTDDDDVPIYGESVVEAVKGFQHRHNLEGDGVLRAGTIAALNVPAASRARQIELALERQRWLPDIGSEPMVFVNAPMLRLWAYDPQRADEPVRMKVATGQPAGHATPLIVDEMEYVIFRPYRDPSPGVIRPGIVPDAGRDTSYMTRQRLEIVALGDDEAALAAWVLRHDRAWTLERILAAMKGARPTRVDLAQTLRVIISYDTAYVDHNGVVCFADDYHGHDARLEKALAHGYPYPRMPEPAPAPEAATGAQT